MKILYVILDLLKQLLPLTYRAVTEDGGRTYFCVWQSWFGVTFNWDEYPIVGE